jgi:hypothetical protein
MPRPNPAVRYRPFLRLASRALGRSALAPLPVSTTRTFFPPAAALQNVRPPIALTRVPVAGRCDGCCSIRNSADERSAHLQHRDRQHNLLADERTAAWKIRDQRAGARSWHEPVEHQRGWTSLALGTRSPRQSTQRWACSTLPSSTTWPVGGSPGCGWARQGGRPAILASKFAPWPYRVTAAQFASALDRRWSDSAAIHSTSRTFTGRTPCAVWASG